MTILKDYDQIEFFVVCTNSTQCKKMKDCTSWKLRFVEYEESMF